MRKLIVLAVLLGTATVAQGADQTILGKTLAVKDSSSGADAAKRAITVVAKEVASPNMLVGDPTATDGSGGGVLEVAVDGTAASGQLFELPQGTSARNGKPFWTAIGTSGFKYSDPAGEQGPVGLAIIQRSASGTVVIKAKVNGKKGSVDVTPPNTGTSGCVALTLGASPGAGDRYSVSFGAGSAITNSGAKLFLAKDPQSEAVCDACEIANGGCDEITPCTFEEEVPECGPCPSGYTGHGSTACNDINECAADNGGCVLSPPVGCTNTEGSRTCGSCPSGYAGTGDTQCTDINECEVDNGGCDVTCENNAGSRECRCPTGYLVQQETQCADINECAVSNGGCETSPVVTCTNIPGSRTCGTCPPGYTGTGETMCNDINECATNNGGCETSPVVTCTNTAGYRTCGSCPAGYTGTGDTQCTDVNECAVNNGGCETSPMVACTNTVGSRICAACPPGYTGTGATMCNDINECATNNGGCDVGTLCENVPPGSFTCP